MNGDFGLDCLRQALEACAKRWIVPSMAAVLILVAFIWYTGLTWLPSLLVAVIALAGYMIAPTFMSAAGA